MHHCPYTPIRTTNAQWGGKHWLRDETRDRIERRHAPDCKYAVCVYCVRRDGDGFRFVRMTRGHRNRSVDHLVIRDHGGSNAHENLVPCHLKCNTARGTQDWQAFLRKRYKHDPAKAEWAIAEIERLRFAPLPR